MLAGVPTLEQAKGTNRTERREDSRVEDLLKWFSAHLTLSRRGRLPPARVVRDAVGLELAA